MSPRLAFAIETAYKAGRATLAHFGGRSKVHLKADQTPVTVADREAERLIRHEIARAYPADGILGEEEGQQGSTDARWVVDPIDGTKSFIAGVPLYATLIAFEHDSEPQIGVCYLPALDQMLHAERGGGAFANGRPCRVSERDRMEGGFMASGSLSSMAIAKRLEPYKRLEEVTLATRTWGDAYGHALVAMGCVEAMIDPIVSYWDIAAMSLIVREAGGRCTDFNGGEVLACEAISSNGRVHEQVLAAFAT